MNSVLDYIPQIAAAGAMGVSILCVIRVYSLLQKEQEQENPRPAFLRSIYVFMGFGLLMTLVALGIEIGRYTMTPEDGTLAGLTRDLEEIEGNTFYVLDKYGNPAEISVNLGGKPYLLGKPFPDTALGETQLNIVKRAGKYRAVRNNASGEITYGYLPEQELKRNLTVFFSDGPTSDKPTPAIPASSPENLYVAGLAFTPYEVKNATKVSLRADRSKANERLIDFLSANGFKDDVLRESAVKLLIQPTMMDKLDLEEHNQLIDLLSTNEVRIAPWRFYEVAQVYYNRSFLMNKEEKEADLKKYQELLTEYLTAYQQKKWTSAKHPGEYGYYVNAAKSLGYEIDGDTGLIRK